MRRLSFQVRGYYLGRDYLEILDSLCCNSTLGKLLKLWECYIYFMPDLNVFTADAIALTKN
ncbi:MAG: hypothetical protein WBM44_14880 [Waterburya sp.]